MGAETANQGERHADIVECHRHSQLLKRLLSRHALICEALIQRPESVASHIAHECVDAFHAHIQKCYYMYKYVSYKVRGYCRQATGGKKFHTSLPTKLSAGASSNESERRSGLRDYSREPMSNISRTTALVAQLRPVLHMPVEPPLPVSGIPVGMYQGELQNRTHMSGGISALCACFVFTHLPPSPPFRRPLDQRCCRTGREQAPPR